MTPLHRLLQRQLQAVLGGPDSGPPELRPLLARVDESYRQFETDYALLERSLELSSQELLQANADMRAVLQALPDVFLWLDSDGTILACRAQDNGELLEPAEQLVGRKIQRLPNTAARVAFETALEGLARGSRVETVDFWLRIGGEQRAYEARMLPLHPGHCLAVIRNISDRKRAEMALKEHAARFQSLMGSVSDAVVMTDEDGVIVGWNPAAASMFGYMMGEALGKSANMLVPESNQLDYSLHMEEIAAKGASHHSGRPRELPCLRKDGTTFPAEISFGIWRADGKPCSGAIIRDISVRKKAEATLVEAREAALDTVRLKSEFLANMSHEIRTPMTSIIGMTELVLGTELTPEQREFLDVVQKSSEALLALLNDILDFSKIDAGKLELEAIPFSLRECLGSALKTFALRAYRKGLELICDISPDTPDRLTGDPSRLRQVILNLVGNAIKFTERGEIMLRVIVDTEIEDRVTLRFAIQDTGIGIPADKQLLIFHPFTQSDGSTTRRYGGTGLGLAICTQIVEMMGGEISVESAPGKGSSFKFSASFHTEESANGPLAPAAEVSLRDRRVLVVDDNATIRSIYTSILDRWGANALAVENGTVALDALQSARDAGTPFDLVLLDFHMPDMDGITVAGKMNQDPKPTTPIILLTSAGEPGDAARCRAVGVAGYFTKPIMSAELIEAIRTVFNAHAAGGQRTLVTRHSLREERNRLRLLLAEDNPVNRSMIACMLEKRGHYVRVVEDGCEVLAALETESFDLILMDVQMPDLDGFAATTAIRQRECSTGGHLPILAITAHALKGDRERCLQHGMDGYLSKPIRSPDLFAAIEELVPGREIGEVRPDDSPDPVGRIFDLRTALRNTEEDRAMLSQAVRICLDDCPRQLEAIHVALERGDTTALERIAHRMKSGLEAVAAEATAQAARRVEVLAASGDLPASRLAVADLHHELDRLTPMLQSLLEAA